MRIGKLKHLVVIQSASRSTDSSGQSNITWSTLASVRASIEQAAGPEPAPGARPSPTRRVTLTIRRRSDVTPTMRVTFSGRTFNIVSVYEPAEDRRWTVLVCEEAI